MKIEDLKADLEEGDWIYRGDCHDCGIPVEIEAKKDINDTITIEGGSVYKITEGSYTKYFFKCDECYKKDKILRNFRGCLVYSRVVGYLRPVSGWNKGKIAEWNVRKEFINTVGE